MNLVVYEPKCINSILQCFCVSRSVCKSEQRGPILGYTSVIRSHLLALRKKIRNN